ncbi:DUF1254 domain-containing protein [Paracoccus marinaquae]|uniref:DUF1254 domain-containing protein n=1 Tax=Paracoccus marinaquae TaxID=2841926 RepID=A0ABS6AMH7_9RHOB|nr:DUF1254 domain-containing protein [Paracoccus marinaquae]MBU3031798.1 DUF1254 domain-containing protein [Paracoccus marinaquae]
MGSAAAAQEKVESTPETYIRAEVDGRMAVFQQRAGGVNKFDLIKRPTPTDERPVVRMNRDTLYGGAVVDTGGGASITMPEITDGRYFTVYLIDSDHYVVGILEGAGTHQFPSGTTKYVIAVPRIELMDPTDEAEIAHVAGLLEQIQITAASSDPFQPAAWDFDSAMKLRREYEKAFVKFDQYPAEWMDVKGRASEETRQVGVAGAWGLGPVSRNRGRPYQPCRAGGWQQMLSRGL